MIRTILSLQGPSPRRKLCVIVMTLAANQLVSRSYWLLVCLSICTPTDLFNQQMRVLCGGGTLHVTARFVRIFLSQLYILYFVTMDVYHPSQFR